jgi:FkbM family methyltransferase
MKVYLNGFWNGFINNTDPQKFLFFKLLLSNVFKEDIVLSNINESDVLVESIFSDRTFINYKKWKHTIFFNGESIERTINVILKNNINRLKNIPNYDCILSGRFTNISNKIVNVPLFIPYIYSNNYLNILQKTERNITKIPSKGICAIISNGEPNLVRNRILNKLDKMVKIDYAGSYKNNVPQIKGSYNSTEMFDFISQYKFVITMENTKQETYITEKIINGFLANVIPIYWGSDNIYDYFNENSFINIPNDSDKAIENAVNHINTLMNDDEKYLKMVNTNVFKNIYLDRTINTISDEIRETILYKYYSQCGEDKFLNKTFFKNKTNGTYIELGALDGVLYSNTKFFEDFLNWKGILIEPHPEKFKSLKKNRRDNFLFNDIVSCLKTEVKFRYFEDCHAAVSGIEDTLPKETLNNYFKSNDNFIKTLQQNKLLLKPKTLTEIVKSTAINHIDFLSLDVEGHEYEVLTSWDFSIPIDLILIETLDFQEDKNELCREILIKNGYKFIQKFNHNEIFVLNTVSFI